MTLKPPPGFNIRKFEQSDLEAFIELGLPTCAFMHNRSGVSEEIVQKRFTSFVREHVQEEESLVYLVTTTVNQIAAQMWLRETTNRFSGLRELWIWDLTVSEPYRRLGLARWLLDLAKQTAQELKTAEIWLLVSSRNQRAIEIYREAGLSPAGHLLSIQATPPIQPSSSAISIHQAGLRPLEVSDVPQLLHLWQEAGLPYRPNGRDSIVRLKQHLLGETTGGWGAFSDGRMIAGVLTSSDGRKGWIERLATLPDYRHAGLAKALVAVAIQTLRDTGALVIAALIEERNTASRNLFESIGFRESPTVSYYTMRDNPGD